MESQRIVKKQLAIRYAGGLQHYDHFKTILGASPALYPHDYLFYNDDVSQRHARNIKELNYLKMLLKEGKIAAEALPFNVFNAYYPSYVLHHHFDIFLPLLAQFNTHNEVKSLLDKAKKLQATGAFFQEKLRLDFKNTDKELPTLNETGVIKMNPETYFYSAITSPYITHCAFLVQSQAGLKLAVVQVRDGAGSFAAGLVLREMGAMISDDYLPIGYNFNGVRPLFTIQLSLPLGKKVYVMNLKHRFNEFGFSLKDLQKSLWVTINYTKMRRQFKTIDESKEERRIISYQAVATRIINGFAQFVALTDLYSRIIDQSRSFAVLSQLLESAHHNILEDLVHLRECCGGYGFMQVSGHAGCIERVSFRAGGESTRKLKLTPEYLQATQYFAASEESEKYYSDAFRADKPSYMSYFGAFLSIVFAMRRNQGSLSDLQFKREFLKQSMLMAMHGREEFSRQEPNNIHCYLLQYSIASYVLKRASYINWQQSQADRTLFFANLEQFRADLLLTITKNLEGLGETLELSYLRNTIVGSEDSEDFYKQVVETAKVNTRNEKEYLAYVQAPIVEMITTNRAKL